MRHYVCVQPHIVGTADNWGYEYTLLPDGKGTPRSAARYGLREFDHDDFYVVGLVDGSPCMIWAPSDLPSNAYDPFPDIMASSAQWTMDDVVEQLASIADWFDWLPPKAL